jgi:hypothetical protein
LRDRRGCCARRSDSAANDPWGINQRVRLERAPI